MPSEIEFRNYFSEKSLHKVYDEHIQFSASSGIDNINQKSFKKIADQQILIASKKILNGSYNFSNYRLKLVSKGRGKFPREISIPTIRDRIVLRALCDLLSQTFRGDLSLELPQNIIKKIKAEKTKYNAFVKLDIRDFYPTISHDHLLSRLRYKIRHKKTLELINKAIQTYTVVSKSENNDKISLGVPQGLSISNILAAIYLQKIDKEICKNKNFQYFRYVDDILILCESQDSNQLANKLIVDFSKIDLKIHDPENGSGKSIIGSFKNDGFNYLGYSFKNLGNYSVSVREESIAKIKNSLASIFTSYKYSKNKNQDFLEWRLNLRITGCILENKCKGWLFFFAEIDDKSLLHELDAYVKHLQERFDVDLSPKKFMRTFHEIQYHKYRTNYIPNFDKYTLKNKQEVLENVFHQNVNKLSTGDIEYRFKKYVTRESRELLEDILNFS
ncbi:reverse transcriptase domain-containing protein [Nostoc sp. PCC 9305]|uniref:reverse transcriptase domain-containing protein n=1 Tax=Nostoc sp. PCC 9305 TaxID=296636 RepID=UPI0039C5C16C